MSGTFIFQEKKDGGLSECFLSEVRDLMAKHQVHNFEGRFSNEDTFEADMTLYGVGAYYYEFKYKEPKSDDTPKAPAQESESKWKSMDLDDDTAHPWARVKDF